MNQKEFKEFLLAQKEELEKYKWIKSEKAGHDVGQAAYMEWVDLYAARFREYWENAHHLDQEEEKITLANEIPLDSENGNRIMQMSGTD